MRFDLDEIENTDTFLHGLIAGVNAARLPVLIVLCGFLLFNYLQQRSSIHNTQTQTQTQIAQ